MGVKQNKKLGCHGISSSHSFYYGHHISTIEGGVISTDNNNYNIALAIRSHGWARDVENNFKNYLEKKFNIDEFKSLYTFYFSD